jgi:hypothetical protein
VFSFVTIPGTIVAGIVLMLIFLLNQYLRQEKEPLLPFAIFRDHPRCARRDSVAGRLELPRRQAWQEQGPTGPHGTW